MTSCNRCTDCPARRVIYTALNIFATLLDLLHAHERMCAADVADLMQPMLADLMRDIADAATGTTRAGAVDGRQGE